MQTFPNDISRFVYKGQGGENLILQKRALWLMFFAKPTLTFLCFERLSLLMHDVYHQVVPSNMRSMFRLTADVHRTRPASNQYQIMWCSDMERTTYSKSLKSLGIWCLSPCRAFDRAKRPRDRDIWHWPTEAWYQFRTGSQIRPSRLSESHAVGERSEVFICFNRHNPIL